MARKKKALRAAAVQDALVGGSALLGVRATAGIRDVHPSVMQAIRERHRLEVAQKQLGGKAVHAIRAVVAQGLKKLNDYRPEQAVAEWQIARYAIQARAPGTEQGYVNAFARAQVWAERVGVQALPMGPFACCRYLCELAQHCRGKELSRKNVDMACAAIAYMHRLAGHRSPTEVEIVNVVRQGIGRELGVKGNQVKPLDDGTLAMMYHWVQANRGEAYAQNMVLLLTVAMLKDGIMRWDDGQRVEYRDLEVTESMVLVFVTEGKTDRKREGFWAMLVQRDEAWSAYQLLVRVRQILQREFLLLPAAQRGQWLAAHMDMVVWQDGKWVLALEAVRLCCPLVQVHGVSLPKGNGVSMSYESVLKGFRRLLSEVGEEPRAYALHSMRRGGATEMRARDVPEEVIAQCGGWKSRESMLRYFDTGIELERRARVVVSAWRESGEAPEVEQG